MNASPDHFDYVVVGGGHNGLTAACYLQKADQSTIVFEATERFGGAAHTGALLSEAPKHLLSLGAQDEFYFSLSGIVDELGLRDVGYRDVDHSELAWLDQDGDASLLLQRDLRRVTGNIEYFSPRDAQRIATMSELAWPILEVMSYFQFRPSSGRTWLGALRRILPFLRGRTRKFLLALLSEGAEDFVLDQFESEAVRSMLLANASIFGDIGWRGTASVVLVTFAMIKWGSRRPVGGMQAIPDALSRRFHALGGVSQADAQVAEIIFDGGRATGVRLTNGKAYRARRGVMMAAAPTLLADLVPREQLTDGMYTKLKTLPMNSHGAGPFKVDLALSGQLAVGRHQTWRAAFDGANLRAPSVSCANYQMLRTNLALAKVGKCPDALPFWSAIMSERDPSVAPHGQDVLYLFAHLPVNIEGGWQANKQRLADKLIAAAASVYPNLAELIIGSVVTSPTDFQDKWKIRNGQYYHVDNDFMRQGAFRPAFGLGGHRLPIRGIYLAGSGASPGGGVGGLPGRAAALKALSDRKRGVVH